MNLSELFRPEDMLLDFAPTDKWAGIREMVEHMRAAGRLPEEAFEGVLEKVLARERSMSTGMEEGIAIPHAAVDEIDSIAACMGIVSAEGGLKFESIDGQPARLIVLLAIPRAQKLLHIRTLADVARVLGTRAVREAILSARTQEDAWEALTSGSDAASAR